MQGYNFPPPDVDPRLSSSWTVQAFRYVPLSSANPIVDELARDRERFVIYNKTDLADPVANKVVKATAGAFLLTNYYSRSVGVGAAGGQPVARSLALVDKPGPGILPAAVTSAGLHFEKGATAKSITNARYGSPTGAHGHRAGNAQCGKIDRDQPAEGSGSGSRRTSRQSWRSARRHPLGIGHHQDPRRARGLPPGHSRRADAKDPRCQPGDETGHHWGHHGCCSGRSSLGGLPLCLPPGHWTP